MQLREDPFRQDTVRDLQIILRLLPSCRKVLSQAFPHVAGLFDRMEEIASRSLNDPQYRSFGFQRLDIDAAMQFYRTIANDPLQRESEIVDSLRTLLSTVSRLSRDFWSGYVLIQLNRIQEHGQMQLMNMLRRHTGIHGLDVAEMVCREYDTSVAEANIDRASFHTDTLNGIRMNGERLPMGGYTTWGNQHAEMMEEHIDRVNFLKISDRVMSDLYETRHHRSIVVDNFRFGIGKLLSKSQKRGKRIREDRAKFLLEESSTVPNVVKEIVIPVRPEVILPVATKRQRALKF